jgi:hypothetical protein
MREFLRWIADAPRTYGQAMEVWKSSCPRHPVFEDALASGLIEIGDAQHIDQRPISLNDRGKAFVQGKKSV